MQSVEDLSFGKTQHSIIYDQKRHLKPMEPHSRRANENHTSEVVKVLKIIQESTLSTVLDAFQECVSEASEAY